MTDDRLMLLDRFVDNDVDAKEHAEVVTLLETDAAAVDALLARAALVSTLHRSLRRRRLQENALKGAGIPFLIDCVQGDLADVGDIEVAPRTLWLVALVSTGQKVVRRTMTLGGLGAIAALVMIALFISNSFLGNSATAASVALDRMIVAVSQSVDRVYRIRVTDHGPDGVAPQVFSGGGGRKPGVDGAELYVRGADKFVLIRQFGNGTKFITGCDGEIGWAVAPKGPIHLSKDTRRFRRAVPGEHEEIPFIDLQSGLAELRRAYDLSLVTTDDVESDMHGWRQLQAVKRNRDYRGPDLVQIWFDTEGVAHRIAITGMQPDPGAPTSVELELIDREIPSADFYQHETHHDAGRPIRWE
jgi:hypothetical protein